MVLTGSSSKQKVHRKLSEYSGLFGNAVKNSIIFFFKNIAWIQHKSLDYIYQLYIYQTYISTVF